MQILRTKYEQVAEVLADRIRRGTYAAGSFLPGERVLGGKLSVSRETIRLGLDLLKQRDLIAAVPGKGYRVLDPDRQHSRVKSHLIGGLLASVTDAYSTGPLTDAAAEAMEEAGFHLVYSVSGDLVTREVVKLRELVAKPLDGLVVQPCFRRAPDCAETGEVGNRRHLLALYEGGLPVVLMDRCFADGGIPCVCNDDEAGGYMATRYLLQRGHRRIHYFSSTGDRIGRLRYRGYCRAMADHGAEPSHSPLQLPVHSLAGVNDELALAATHQMLDSLRNQTAIVTSGRFPFYLDRFARERGTSLEWIGYDLGPRAMVGDVRPFPYVMRPMVEIGRRAARKVVALIEGDRSAATEEYLPPHIVEPTAQQEEPSHA